VLQRGVPQDPTFGSIMWANKEFVFLTRSLRQCRPLFRVYSIRKLLIGKLDGIQSIDIAIISYIY
jgi:hypothetical protein